MAGSLSAGGGDIHRSGVPTARLVVQRLGLGLGGSSRRGSCFWPLVSRGSGCVHKRQRASCRRSRSSVLCFSDFELHGGLVHRQLHSNSLSSQPRRHSFSTPQLHRPAHPQMGGVASGGIGSTIYYGTEQCSGRFPLQIQSDLRVGMNSEDRSFSRSAQEVASVHRSFRHLVKLPMLPYFSPFHDPNALGTDALLQNWNGWQSYTFPPWSLIPAVLKKLRSSS